MLERAATRIGREPNADTAAIESLDAARQVRYQDVASDDQGRPTLRKGVAPDRRVEDAEMRHGRRTRSLLVDGCERHVLKDMDSRLVRAVGVRLANAPAASVADQIEADPDQQAAELRFMPGANVQFPAEVLRRLPAAPAVQHQPCGPQRAGPPDERLLVQRPARQQTPEGQARQRRPAPCHSSSLTAMRPE